MKPYYEHAGNDGRFKKGEARLKIKTPAHRKAISEGQRRAWKRGRKNGGERPIGTTYTDSNGYVRVKVREGAGRWEIQHVMVMEKIVGRKLRPEEIVHHIDGDRSHNAPDNLYLCRNHAHHMEIERQLKEKFRSLLKRGFVTFDHSRGEYQ